MKLSIISEQDGRNRRTRVYNFNYPDKTEHGPTHDKHPKALFLGGWWHPTTGNRLFGGVNLNYLSAAQLDRVRRELPNIFGKGGNLRSRARAVRALIPDVFDTAYRTYNLTHINGVTLDTVHFIPPEEADKKLDPHGAMQPEPRKGGEVPEIPEVPTVSATPEVPEEPEVPEAPEAQAPEAPEAPQAPAPTPEVPGAAGPAQAPELASPTSSQRRAMRPDVVDKQPSMPSPSTPGIKVKSSGRPEPASITPTPSTPQGAKVEPGRPKPTSYQRRKGILGRLKDKVTGWGSSLADFFSKWRKKKPG